MAAKLPSPAMRVILSPGAKNNAIVETLLGRFNIDVVERHELDDGNTLFVVESLPDHLDEDSLHCWVSTMTQREIEFYLTNVRRGIPSLRIFPTHK